jgi:hypothetical protein
MPNIDKKSWEQWRSRNKYMRVFWFLCLTFLPLITYAYELRKGCGCWEAGLLGFCLGVVASVPSYWRFKWRGNYGPNCSPVLENIIVIALSASILLYFSYGWIRLWGWQMYKIAGPAMVVTAIVCHFLWPPVPEHNIIIKG